MTPADLRELLEDLRARGCPAAALADAIPDRLEATALEALTPAIVRALRASIYGKPNAPTDRMNDARIEA